MLDSRTFGLHVLRPSQAILFGPRSALMTRLNGKSAALPQGPSPEARERKPCYLNVSHQQGYMLRIMPGGTICSYIGSNCQVSVHTRVFAKYDESFPHQRSCLCPTFLHGNRKSFQMTFSPQFNAIFVAKCLVTFPILL